MLIMPDLEAEHELLCTYIDELEAIARNPDPKLDEVEPLLASFAQLLHIHLLREDGLLYPALAQGSGDATCTALRLQAEADQLAERLTALESWTPDTILSRWAEFRSALESLVGDLRSRISREDEELYPLVSRGSAEDQAPVRPDDRSVTHRQAA